MSACLALLKRITDNALSLFKVSATACNPCKIAIAPFTFTSIFSKSSFSPANIATAPCAATNPPVSPCAPDIKASNIFVSLASAFICAFVSPIWSVNSPARADISLNFLEPASPLNSIAASSCFNSLNSAFRLLFLFTVFCVCSPNSVIAASAILIFCESAANSSLFGSSEFKIVFAKSTPAANCCTALSVFSSCFSNIPSAVGSISISSFVLIPDNFF